MQWILRDGPRQLVLSTERGAPFGGAVLVEDSSAAASTLRNMAYDPNNMKTLRQIHQELLHGHNSRSRADTLVLAELMGQVASRRLFLFESGRAVELTYELPEPTEEPIWEDSEVLVATPAAPPPEPPPSAAVLAQSEALRQAAESGAPFCEE